MPFFDKKFGSFLSGQLRSVLKSYSILLKNSNLRSSTANSAKKAVEKLVENVDNIGRNVANMHNYRILGFSKNGKNKTFQKEKKCNML